MYMPTLTQKELQQFSNDTKMHFAFQICIKIKLATFPKVALSKLDNFSCSYFIILSDSSYLIQGSYLSLDMVWIASILHI